MYIDHIRLTNIRGFQQLEFSFDRGGHTYAGWTVLTGDNGSGKSTLLKSMAIMLMDTSSMLRLENDLNKYIRYSRQDPSAIDLTFSTGQHLTLTLTLGQFNRIPEHKGTFACGYGPFRRITGSSDNVKALMSDTATGRFITMFQESASLAEVDQWLRQLNYKKLEGKAPEAATLDVVLQLLNHEFLPNHITVDRVDSDGLWLKDRQGVELSWSDMSDGYRSALALLADILRHMVNHYGLENLTARDADGNLFVQCGGIVLIDEIDAHLHPEWQREIGFWLKRHFPNVQFIVTSHSPLICQAADPNGLFVLPEPGSDEPARALTPEEYQAVISSKPDTILRSPAFGLRNTRSDWVVDKQTRYAKLKARQRRLQNLTPDETAELTELGRFVNPDEEP